MHIRLRKAINMLYIAIDTALSLFHSLLTCIKVIRSRSRLAKREKPPVMTSHQEGTGGKQTRRQHAMNRLCGMFVPESFSSGTSSRLIFAVVEHSGAKPLRLLYATSILGPATEREMCVFIRAFLLTHIE